MVRFQQVPATHCHPMDAPAIRGTATLTKLSQPLSQAFQRAIRTRRQTPARQASSPHSLPWQAEESLLGNLRGFTKVRRLLLLLFLLLLVPSSRAQTWTYVQESVITYCANNTSSCSNFGGTMIPTLSNSIWIFGISTTNDVTATVSGGGATWTECATCTTFLSGFRRNRVFYAIGGTAGSTNFSITLSGSSGSAFAVTFVEVLPPAGATASFDVGGATASSTCSGTCTGVGLTLSSTDVVVQFLNRTAPANWKGWASPYETLPNGDGIHVNARAGSEAAPSVNVLPGATGAVFSAIAFKSSAGSFTPPAAGPMSL